MDEKYSVKLAELTQESEKDIKIDFLKLTEELAHNQNLIGKWMTYQQVWETKYQFLDLEYRQLLASKTKYYTGKMSEDEIISKGWEIEGTKILKADLNIWVDDDNDMIKAKKKMLILKQIINIIDKTIDILVDQKKWTIKNFIDYKKWARRKLMSKFYVSKLNEVYVQVDSPELFMLKELVDYFTFKVPGAEFMPSYKNKYWDGKIRLFNPMNCKLYLGLVSQLKFFCEKNDYEIVYDEDLKDQEFTPKDLESLAKFIKPHSQGAPIAYRDYQLDAIYHAI